MKFSAVIRAEAEEEFIAAFDWYESRLAGLGKKFATSVELVLERLVTLPLIHGFVHADIRCALVPRFPYGIYYFVDGSRVVVTAIYHSSRNPTGWQSRK